MTNQKKTPQRSPAAKRRLNSRERLDSQSSNTPDFDDHLDDFPNDEASLMGVDDLNLNSIFRSMESHLSLIGGGETQGSPQLQAAQKLVYQAWGETSFGKQQQLMQQALETSPDCADAWNWMAEQADSAKAANQLFENAVEAGRRGLGNDFDKYLGGFWGFHQTRPFMRAMQGLAETLAAMGKRDAAMDRYSEMLELNPNDNQGIRRSLMKLLLEDDRDDDAQNLLDQFPEDAFALWPFAKLLLGYRRRVADEELIPILEQAHQSNPYTAKMLIEGVIPSHEGGGGFTFGTQSEAADAVALMLPAWRGTAGALPWLRKLAAAAQLPAATPSAKSASPTPALKPQAALFETEDLLAVASRPDANWKIDYEKVTLEGQKVWFVQIIGPDGEGMRIEPVEEKPDARLIFELICDTIVNEQGNYRPEKILFSKKTIAKSLTRRLSRLGIEVSICQPSELPSIKKLVAQTGRSRQGTDTIDPSELVSTSMVWQVGTQVLEEPVDDGGELIRPHATLIVDQETGMVFGADVMLTAPGPQDLANQIRAAMFHDVLPQPARPGAILLRTADEMVGLRPLLAQWDIACEVSDDFDAWNEVSDSMAEHRSGSTMPALHSVPGINDSDMGAFYESATKWYGAKVWLKTASDSILKMSGPELSEDLYVSNMGQNGEVIGVAIYNHVEGIRALFRGEPASPESPTSKVWSVMFNEPHEINLADTELIESHGWPIAGADAWPSICQVKNQKPTVCENRTLVHDATLCLAALAAANWNDENTTREVRIPGGTAVTISEMEIDE